jgi:xylulose-5-phosphate/fructose-6-phosphate phosphoketolase
VIDRLTQPESRADGARRFIREKLFSHKQYITEHGEDLPEIRNWKWEPVDTSGQS